MQKTLVIGFMAMVAMATTDARAQDQVTAPAAGTATASGPVKVGHTRIDYILSQTPESKTITSQLNAQQKQAETELQRMQKELQDKFAAYQQGVGQMTDMIRKDRETELQSLQNRIQEFSQTAEASLQNKYRELVDPVLQKIQKNINEVAAENGYAYIFNLDSGINAVPTLLYTPKEHDVTPLILKKMGITPTANPAPTTTQKPTNAGGSAPAKPATTPKKK